MIGRNVSHYHIVDRLGAGGMGVVFRARDLRLDCDRAIKFIDSAIARDPVARARFLREAQAASALEHPGICTIHEIDETDDGVLFIVMPCYEGENLRQRMERGPVEPDQALSIASQLADALAATHARGIIHRDIKPANIMLVDGGRRAVLMDFGLARPMDETALTRTGALAGTPAYMAPEQLRGKVASPASDAYSLGLVLREMLGRSAMESTARSGYQDDTLAVTGQPMLGRVRLLLARLLEQDPEYRLADADEIRREVNAARADLTIMRVEDNLAPANKAVRGRLLGISISIVLVVALALAWRPWSTPQPSYDDIAVLPFADLSPRQDQAWFCAGMTDALIQALGEAGVPRVVSRTSAEYYRRTELSISDIARQLDVDAVVEASILSSGDRLRVNVRLLKGDSERQLWGESFERPVRDVLDLHAEIVQRIADRVRLAVSSGRSPPTQRGRQVDPEAFRAYLRGQEALLTAIEGDDYGWQQGAEHFERAVAIDSTCAEAWAGLAEWNVRSLHADADPRLAIPAARAALRRAFSIDPDLQPAWSALAHLTWEHEWKGPEAAEAFRRALALNPSNSYTKTVYAYYCATNRRFSEGAEAIRQACRVDPWSRLVQSKAHVPLALAGLLEESLASMDRAEERFPQLRESGAWIASRAEYLFSSGDREGSLGMLRDQLSRNRDGIVWSKLVSLSARIGDLAAAGAELDSLLVAARTTRFDPLLLATACAEVGRSTLALGFLRGAEPVPVSRLTDVAYVHLLLGDLDRCFEILEEAYREGCIWLSRINCDPRWYDRVHEYPRFRDLVTRMGLSL